MYLKEQVGGLKQEFASLKSELSEVTQLLKMLLVESPREGTVQMMTSKISSKVESSRNPDIEMAQSFTSQRINKNDKVIIARASYVNRKQGKQRKSDDSSVETCSSSSISGGGKDSNQC